MERLCGHSGGQQRQFLVRDHKTRQEVLVRTSCTCGFQRNDRVIILYNGAMTMSIPPQINAIRVTRTPFNRCPR